MMPWLSVRLAELSGTQGAARQVLRREDDGGVRVNHIGFSALEMTPLWYRVLIGTVYLATFGVRMWRRDMNKGTDVVGMLK